jgi:hypothetical protein
MMVVVPFGDHKRVSMLEVGLKVHSHFDVKSMLNENLDGILGGTQC